MITQDAIVNLNLLPGDALEIEWVDARYLSGWHDRPEILSWERDFNKHRSTGTFVFANDENLLFCETWSPPGWEHKSVGGTNSIPLSSILGIWRLERVEIVEAQLGEAKEEVSHAGAPSNAVIAELAFTWRTYDAALSRALSDPTSARVSIIDLQKPASEAAQALRVAVDQRLAADGEDG
jgi:hypothetical protein